MVVEKGKKKRLPVFVWVENGEYLEFRNFEPQKYCRVFNELQASTAQKSKNPKPIFLTL